MHGVTRETPQRTLPACGRCCIQHHPHPSSLSSLPPLLRRPLTYDLPPRIKVLYRKPWEATGRGLAAVPTFFHEQLPPPRLTHLPPRGVCAWALKQHSHTHTRTHTHTYRVADSALVFGAFICSTTHVDLVGRRPPVDVRTPAQRRGEKGANRIFRCRALCRL